VNIQDAIDVIESVAGFTDESTPVGDAWAEVLSYVYRPRRPSSALAQPELCDLHREMVAESVARRARVALAQPEPVAPTDDELLKLLSRVSGLPDCDTYIVDGGRIMSEPNELLAFARAVLARWGTPANNTRKENLDG
jgi:hypothetical protein